MECLDSDDASSTRSLSDQSGTQKYTCGNDRLETVRRIACRNLRCSMENFQLCFQQVCSASVAATEEIIRESGVMHAPIAAPFSQALIDALYAITIGSSRA